MQQAKSKKQVYTRSFHLLVLKDYYESGSSIGSIVRKYGLSCNAVLHYWLKKYPVSSKSLSLSSEIIDKVMKKQQLDSTPKTKAEELELEIERLRKALAYSELRNEALNEVINIGKEEYGIDLLKKAGAKQ